jgi:glycerophosphoryl diester phosphodiesterase
LNHHKLLWRFGPLLRFNTAVAKAIDLDLRLYGHRGSSALLPENTMGAFRQALDDGATALEMDLHQTADGHFVVAHDPDGERMAGHARRIRDCTLDEVRRWNVGSGFPNDGDRSHLMPTLDEVLEELPDVPLSVDLKSGDPAAIPDLLALISGHGAAHRVIIGSFHDRLVYLARRLGYAGPTSLTRGEVAAVRLTPPAVSRRLVRGLAAMIPRRGWGFRLDGRGFIDRCRKLGLRVDFWVVNQPEEARDLLAAGATGIISDDPGAIVSVMQEFAR